MIRTVTGDISPAALGICSAHEHLLGRPHDPAADEDLCLTDERAAAAELAGFYAAGGRALVEMSPADYGRREADYPLERILPVAERASTVSADPGQSLAEARMLLESLGDRDSAVRYWAAFGIRIRGAAAVATLSPDVVEAADALAICNAVRGILPVVSLGARAWAPHPALVELQERLAMAYPMFSEARFPDADMDA